MTTPLGQYVALLMDPPAAMRRRKASCSQCGKGFVITAKRRRPGKCPQCEYLLKRARAKAAATPITAATLPFKPMEATKRCGSQ